MRYLLIALALILGSCKYRDNFSISGQLPDKSYDGEVIYMVPMDKPFKGCIDSMVVKDGTIHFQGHVSNSEICIIRARPVLRFILEELLVVREPGFLTVKIDKRSSVRGTPLNDSLQYWKDRKMRYDFVNAELIKRFHESKDDAEKQILKAKQDSLMVLSNKFHLNFVLRNKGNIVGQFVQNIMSGSFTEEQKQMLKSLP